MTDCQSAVKLKPGDLAREWGVKVDRMLAWIHRGELRAVDASSCGGARPRWLIDRKDIAEFEQRRANPTPAPAPPRQRRRPKYEPGDFFRDGKLVR